MSLAFNWRKLIWSETLNECLICGSHSARVGIRGIRELFKCKVQTTHMRFSCEYFPFLIALEKWVIQFINYHCINSSLAFGSSVRMSLVSLRRLSCPVFSLCTHTHTTFLLPPIQFASIKLVPACIPNRNWKKQSFAIVPKFTIKNERTAAQRETGGRRVFFIWLIVIIIVCSVHHIFERAFFASTRCRSIRSYQIFCPIRLVCNNSSRPYGCSKTPLIFRRRGGLFIPCPELMT